MCLREKMLGAAILAMLVVAIGCGGPKRGAVEGRLTLDGRPVDGGTISFVPVDGDKDLIAWAEIRSGAYFIPAKKGPLVGENRVEIYWKTTSELIPNCYNSMSELKVDIKPDKNEFNLDMRSR